MQIFRQESVVFEKSQNQKIHQNPQGQASLSLSSLLPLPGNVQTHHVIPEDAVDHQAI